jgi:hypothetical protein
MTDIFLEWQRTTLTTNEPPNGPTNQLAEGDHEVPNQPMNIVQSTPNDRANERSTITNRTSTSLNERSLEERITSRCDKQATNQLISEPSLEDEHPEVEASPKTAYITRFRTSL